MADSWNEEDGATTFARAKALCDAGDTTAATALLPELLAARPDALSVRLLVARCAAQGGEPAVARAAAEAAVACDPGSWEAQVLLADALAPTDTDAALAAASQAVHLAPHEPAAVAAHARAAATLAEPTTPAPGAGLGSLLGGDRGLRKPAGAPAPPGNPALGLPPATEVDRPHERPLRLPAALRDPADPTGTDPSDEEPGGSAPAAADTGALARDAAPSPSTDAEDLPAWRSAIRVLGLVLWVYLGFRYGIQVIGGPVGFLVFAATLGLVAVAVRSLRAT
ncbi:hypothetical protein HC251_23670 [Iamia sp. SCSIO 61187]|uniref:hypothetical protein n=1 Tax=Iamia sp. SCSIO 61187 TaxID=2722752 RepID=UPI001C633281|nr:hypothetical protein [Iamia sp. SCSIO 61187]QYG95128.1 hypothetical protein HC251_23670 [Iamia sp. SCSIO 61187]